jgi:hypothetical protein
MTTPRVRTHEAALRLVRLTAEGPDPSRVVIPRGGRILFFNERDDGPVAVVLRPSPGRDEGSPTLTPVPLGPGDAVALRCELPGDHVVEVHSAVGPSADVLIVVDPGSRPEAPRPD